MLLLLLLLLLFPLTPAPFFFYHFGSLRAGFEEDDAGSHLQPLHSLEYKTTGFSNCDRAAAQLSASILHCPTAHALAHTKPNGCELMILTTAMARSERTLPPEIRGRLQRQQWPRVSKTAHGFAGERWSDSGLPLVKPQVAAAGNLREATPRGNAEDGSAEATKTTAAAATCYTGTSLHFIACLLANLYCMRASCTLASCVRYTPTDRQTDTHTRSFSQHTRTHTTDR